MKHVMRIKTPFGTKEVVFHSKFVGRTVGSRFHMAIDPDTILDANDYINKPTFVHECGHGEDAKRLGWKYIPWVLWHYLKEGYPMSLPERRADAFMVANLDKFNIPDVLWCPICHPEYQR